MEPVLPKSERRFWNCEPSMDLATIFCKDWSELTGAEGSIQPAPVPEDPDMRFSAQSAV